MNDLPGWCPKCETEEHVNIIDSRPSRTGRIRRYRCSKCEDRWSTVETRSNSPKDAVDFMLKDIDKKLDSIVVIIQSIEDTMSTIREHNESRNN